MRFTVAPRSSSSRSGVGQAQRPKRRGAIPVRRLVGLALALLGGVLYVGGRLLRPTAGVPVGSWVAMKPANLSFGTGSGPATMTLEMGPTTRVRLSLAPVAVFESTATTVADHELQLVITSVTPLGGRGSEFGTPVAIDQVQLAGCKLGDVGRYRWSDSADSAPLTLASAGDACPSREAGLARTWNAHEIPFGSWVATKPANLSFGTPSAAGETFEPRSRVDGRGPPVGDCACTTLQVDDDRRRGPRGVRDRVAPRVPGRGARFRRQSPPCWLRGRRRGPLRRRSRQNGSELTLASTGDACPSREAVLART